MNRFAVSRRMALMVGAMLLGSTTLLMAQAGSLDPTFGTGGIVTTPNTFAPTAAAIESDGKIVVAGSAPNSQNFTEPAVARYNTNGSLDSTFGNGGIVVVTENDSGPALGLAIQSDGKIVFAAPGNLDLDVIRLNTNGSLDTTFGTAGVSEVEVAQLVISPISGGIAVETDGNILVAVGGVLVRLLTNGQLDSTFGTGGAAGLVSAAQTLTLLPSGKILVASSFAFTSGAATRYNGNGSLDTSFGVVGQVPSLGPASAIAPLSNNKFIVVGTLDDAAPSVGGNALQGFAVVRYNPNGTIDTTFGVHGGAVTPFPGNASSAALAVAVQSNGDVVAAGQTAAKNFALARYTPSGQLDTTFGTAGLVTTAFGADVALVSAVAIQSDGKIVAVGSDGANGFTLARYLGQ